MVCVWCGLLVFCFLLFLIHYYMGLVCGGCGGCLFSDFADGFVCCGVLRLGFVFCLVGLFY